MANRDNIVTMYGLIIGKALLARENGMFRGMTLGQIVNMFLIEVTGN